MGRGMPKMSYSASRPRNNTIAAGASGFKPGARVEHADSAEGSPVSNAVRVGEVLENILQGAEAIVAACSCRVLTPAVDVAQVDDERL